MFSSQCSCMLIDQYRFQPLISLVFLQLTTGLSPLCNPSCAAGLGPSGPLSLCCSCDIYFSSLVTRQPDLWLQSIPCPAITDGHTLLVCFSISCVQTVQHPMSPSELLGPVCNYRCVAAGPRNRCALIYLWQGGGRWGSFQLTAMHGSAHAPLTHPCLSVHLTCTPVFQSVMKV